MTAEQAVRAYILADSARADRELAARLAAWSDGWRACETRNDDQYQAGYIDGLLDRKHAQHDMVAQLRLDQARWGPGGRGRFADPRPGDYPGGPVPWEGAAP